ncbi:hypothetical protein HID58_048357 [Brassica napus]|uniref:Uncharacterized protein n=1 Tax=Brassica napus TaxID=3708 RepID=A0ABQ8B1W7_BRANA|nr:hypothetical protein HID58_048357 [Brassica napus]
MATLRRGNLRWLVFTVERIRAAYALPRGQGKQRFSSIAQMRPLRPGCRNGIGKLDVGLLARPAVRVKEQQREVEVEELKGKLAAAEAEKVAVQNDLVPSCSSLSCSRVRCGFGRSEGLAAGEEEGNSSGDSSVGGASSDRSFDRVRQGGYELEEELERLKSQEISLDVDYGLASVSNPSLNRLDLPQISGDSVNQN